MDTNPITHLAHEMSLMKDLAIILSFSLFFGLLAARFKFQPIVGYLIAGVLCGPHTPGFISDVHRAEQLGEIGVVFLMFGVGLHFSVKSLMGVRNIALPGALAQSAITTILTIGLFSIFGWSLGAGIVFGLALSVASTVVLVKALEARSVLATHGGEVAVGWLIIEDIFSALVLVLLPLLATALGANIVSASSAESDDLIKTLLTEGDSLLAFGARQMGVPQTMLIIAFITLLNTLLLVVFLPVMRFVLNWLYNNVFKTSSAEILTLTTVVSALFIAFMTSAVFGLSVALGAFFAGLVISGNLKVHQIAEDVRPLRDLFGVIFFASVGMMLDPMTIIKSPFQLTLVLLVIMCVKPLAAMLILHLLKQSPQTIYTVSPALGQIGEFSFILAAIGRSTGLLPDEAFQLIVTSSIISIALNPILFLAANRMQKA